MQKNKCYILFLVILCILGGTDNLCRQKSFSIEGIDDSSSIHKSSSNISFFQYIVNDYMSVSINKVENGIYQCFVKEEVAGINHAYSMLLDDASKYNYIPFYDSLEYDLKLTFDDTEYGGKKVSSKFNKVFMLRFQSDEYKKMIESCDDINDLLNFCNQSLYFQAPDSIFSKTDKINALIKLIEITQIQLVDIFLDEYSCFKNEIVLGWISIFDSYNLIKFVKPNHNQVLYHFRKNYEMVDYGYGDWISEKCEQVQNNFDYYNNIRKFLSLNSFIDEYIDNQIQNKCLFYYSNYLLNLQNENLKFINNKREIIYNEMEDCDLFICADYKYNISRLFFFNIDITNDSKFALTKKFFNKEYLPTTRISNYYLDY